MEGVCGGSIRPFPIAYDHPVLMRESGKENQVGEREDDPTEPNPACDSQRHPTTHPRLQRIHYGCIPTWSKD